MKRVTISTILKKLSLIAVVTAPLVACSSNSQPQHLSSTTQIIREPAPLVVVDDKTIAKNFQLVSGNDPAVVAAFKRYTKTGKAPNIKTDGFERFAFSNMSMPVINCVPFQETIISLQPGEKFTSITSGDPQNLSYQVAVSGSSTGTETQQVLVKPGKDQMSTNLVIATDKRIYNILIVVGASSKKVTRNVGFWYPDDMTASLNQRIEKSNEDLNAEHMAQVDLKNANFDYKISGDSPSWKPTRIFDDGKHTWIQMPPGTDNKNLPTILIQSDSGQDMKYNVSYYSPYMIIDGIFGQAKLVAGVGSSQVEVDVTNKNYKQ